MSLGALLLAAGQSRRFGAQDKLLADLSGAPLVSHAARLLDRPQIAHRIAVVSSDAVAALLGGMGFAVAMQAPGQPQSASLAAGIAALRSRGADRALILLGDMPFLQAGDIAALLALPADRPASAWAQDAPCPPAVFPESWFDRLSGLTGDRGAGALLRDLPPEGRLALPAQHLRDIDRPQDL